MSSGRGRGRLPSFMGKRDLTLSAGAAANKKAGAGGGLPGLNKAAGASDKKKFVPNLNVQRKAKAEPSDASAPSAKSSKWKKPEAAVPYSSSHAGAGDRGGDNKKVGFKPRPELIQTMDAVFGEGIRSDGIRRKKYGGGGGGGGGGEGAGSSLERPKLNLNLKIDKEAEAGRLKALLKDDFIDDLSSGPLVPVQLPMVDTGTLFKKEKEEEAEEEIKNVKKKSKRILDSDDDEDEEEKKEVKKPSVIASDSKSDVLKTQLTFPDLVKAQKGDLFFIQLPDHLPGPAPKAGAPPPVEEEGEEASAAAAAAIATELDKCTLADLSEGYLGKIQIRKSGRTQLVMGGASNHMNIDLGTQVGFLQDLVAVNMPEQAPAAEQSSEPPDMTVIGHIKHRLVVAPDWSKLFGGIDAQPPSSDEDETL